MFKYLNTQYSKLFKLVNRGIAASSMSYIISKVKLNISFIYANSFDSLRKLTEHNRSNSVESLENPSCYNGKTAFYCVVLKNGF